MSPRVTVTSFVPFFYHRAKILLVFVITNVFHANLDIIKLHLFGSYRYLFFGGGKAPAINVASGEKFRPGCSVGARNELIWYCIRPVSTGRIAPRLKKHQHAAKEEKPSEEQCAGSIIS
jgi:hypothetical protein